MKKYIKPAIKAKKINFNYFYSQRRSFDSMGFLSENFIADATTCVNTCFIPGSKVFMANNEEKNIEDVKKNEEVYSYNLTADEFTKNKVVKVIEKTYDEGYFIINGIYKPTPNHPFWVINQKEWKRADELVIGDELFNYENKKVKVIKIKKVNGSYIVYNLHLKEKEHNFFVEKILVHNDECE